MQSKFKKGDRVRIKENFDKITPTTGQDPSTHPEMMKFVGKIRIIKNVNDDTRWITLVREEGDEEPRSIDYWTWHEDWLDKVGNLADQSVALCTCDDRVLFSQGCQCGAIQKERATA